MDSQSEQVRNALLILRRDVGQESVDLIVDVFRDTTSQNIAAIKTAVVGADSTKLSFEAHKLKGACGIFRLDAIQHLAVEIEQYAKQNSFAEAGILCDEIEALYSEFLDVFEGSSRASSEAPISCP